MISIIVPVYNVEKYLKKCIESVLRQTYKDFELILVNDGSTDKSGKICDEYLKLDKRIRVIHKKNGGLSDARNIGIKAAKGEYIAFLDSDDWIENNCYETLINLIKENNADISICNFKSVINDKEQLDKYEKFVIEKFNNIEALNQIYDKKNVEFILAWNKLFKKELLENNKFPKGKIHEDEFLIPKIIYNAKCIIYLNRQLIYYRKTENSIMNRTFNKKRLDYIEALNDRNMFFEENNLIELQQKNINRLSSEIIRHYCLSKEAVDNERKEIQNYLLKCIEKIRIADLTKKEKIKIVIFKFSPNIYNVIFKLYKKIRK